MNTQQMKRCPRCLGQKKMYKMGSGYSSTNSGGPQVNCPCCLGEGWIKTLEAAVADLNSSSPLKSENSKRTRPKKEAILPRV
jgi:hypothetical protein